MKHLFKKKEGFTLIELLVTIAIIVVLAAILFPVFARARENARRAGCMSNLKQLGMGVMMYVQDYDEWYPKSYSSGMPLPPDGEYWGSAGNWFWPQTIYPYTKSDQLYVCPNTQSDEPNKPYMGNYGSNRLIMPIGSDPLLNMSAITSPSEIYLLMDAGAYVIRPYDVLHPNGDYNYFPGSYQYSGATFSSTLKWAVQDYEGEGRHFDGVNVAFADGHVKWLKVSEVYKEGKKYQNGGNSQKQSLWNPMKG